MLIQQSEISVKNMYQTSDQSRKKISLTFDNSRFKSSYNCINLIDFVYPPSEMTYNRPNTVPL